MATSESLLSSFKYDNLPEELQPLGAAFYDLAKKIDRIITDESDKYSCLRALLETKQDTIYAAMSESP